MPVTYFSNNNGEWNYNSTTDSKQKQNSKNVDKNLNFLESSNFREWPIHSLKRYRNWRTPLKFSLNVGSNLRWKHVPLRKLWARAGFCWPENVSSAVSGATWMSLLSTAVTTFWNNQFQANPWWTAEHKRNLCCSCQELARTGQSTNTVFPETSSPSHANKWLWIYE